MQQKLLKKINLKQKESKKSKKVKNFEIYNNEKDKKVKLIYKEFYCQDNNNTS